MTSLHNAYTGDGGLLQNDTYFSYALDANAPLL